MPIKVVFPIVALAWRSASIVCTYEDCSGLGMDAHSVSLKIRPKIERYAARFAYVSSVVRAIDMITSVVSLV